MDTVPGRYRHAVESRRWATKRRKGDDLAVRGWSGRPAGQQPRVDRPVAPAGLGCEQAEHRGKAKDAGRDRESRTVGSGVHQVTSGHRPGDGTDVTGHLVRGDNRAALVLENVAQHGGGPDIEEPGSEPEYRQRGEIPA